MPSAATAPAKRRWLVVAAAVACFSLAGVGWWVWPTAVPDTVQASVLTSGEVSKIVGTALVSHTSVSEPAPPLSADPPSCAVAVGPGTQPVYASGWTAFVSVTYQDSAAVADHSVTQVVGVYSDSDRARAVFRTLTEGLKGCKSAVRTDQDTSTSRWAYKVGATTSEKLTWTATQDAGDGWACYRQARLKAKAVLQVAVCGAGDGKPSAARIIDRFAGNVGG